MEMIRAIRLKHKKIHLAKPTKSRALNQTEVQKQIKTQTLSTPQPTSLTTNEVPTVTIQPGEGYDNAVNGLVDFNKNHPENIATCMANDGTYNLALKADGTFLKNTKKHRFNRINQHSKKLN